MKPQSFPRLPKEIETTIFRIIQESLSNIYRHSGSESARVEIERLAEIVVVRIRDYGKGMPAALLGKNPSVDQGVGVSGMRERVRQLNGKMILARAEPGTLVEARIPIFGVTLD